MLKKVVILLIIVLMIVGISSINAYAVGGEEVLNSDQAAEIVQMKETSKAKVQDYIDKYGSTPYGIAAYSNAFWKRTMQSLSLRVRYAAPIAKRS